MTKILIAGIGGVGGYFGGLLARAFAQNADVQINFLARGAHLQEIQKNGLTVLDDGTEFIARPRHVTDNAGILEKMDYILLCTKSYDLLPLLEQLRVCIDDETVILPLLNGVDNQEHILRHFPSNILAEGCVHISSRYVSPGRVTKTGPTAKLFFGLAHSSHARLELLLDIMLLAGIDATCTPDISTITWEKFIFIASFATATSFFDSPVGSIMEDPARQEDLYRLFCEATALAEKKGFSMPEDLPDLLLKRLMNVPYTSTSSMHSDFLAQKGKTELDSLTGYLVREGVKYGLPTPVFASMYIALQSR
ncbi:ketopantoate reductase family protein [Dyadobacter sp. 32]|uniref:ketopantoate reductase family protein n=1 Tax=Dyadobacter sp. 32 TaxID=538966 RepID=UPI0039C6E2BC